MQILKDKSIRSLIQKINYLLTVPKSENREKKEKIIKEIIKENFPEMKDSSFQTKKTVTNIQQNH